MTHLLSVYEAQQRIIDHFQPTASEDIDLLKASDRILALEVKANINLPVFSNSGMDGFAVIAGDTTRASTENPIVLKVVADIPAGSSVETCVHSGEAARIMTGGKMPCGADAVIPVENTDQADHQNNMELNDQVRILAPARSGDYIRAEGQNARVGDVILSPGRKLTPQDIGAIAAFGYPSVSVHKYPRIALLTTGDELVTPGQVLEEGKIFDSNTSMLSAMVEEYGGTVIDRSIAPDKPDTIRECLEAALKKKPDLFLSSAGVSVGTYDFTKKIVEESGKLDFWRVNMRPGKPIAFGNYRNVPLIGLPGNPVSAFVGFLVFVVPAIHKMAGLAHTSWPCIKVHLEHAVESDGRETYFRANTHLKNGRLFAGFSGNQGSDNLVGLTRANTLLIIPSGVKSLAIGSEVDAWLLGPADIE